MDKKNKEKGLGKIIGNMGLNAFILSSEFRWPIAPFFESSLKTENNIKKDNR